MEKIKVNASVFKTFGLTGIILCGLCCALPIIGSILAITYLTAIAYYLQKTGIVVLGLAGLFFVLHTYQKWREIKTCSSTCDMNCSCKTNREMK